MAQGHELLEKETKIDNYYKKRNYLAELKGRITEEGRNQLTIIDLESRQ